jgi:hypothetical protein
MNQPDESRIAELAMKTVAHQLTSDEQAEVDAILTGGRAGKIEFERLLAEAKALADVMSLMTAAESTTGTLPGYARERLRTKVRQTYRAENAAKAKAIYTWSAWRLWLSATAGLATMICAALLLFQAQAPVVQVAMLDPVGSTRGGANSELMALKEAFPKGEVSEFRTQEAVDILGQKMASNAGDRALVVFDRSAGEVRVTGSKNGVEFIRTFAVENDLKRVLHEAQSFVVAQFK